MQRTFVAENKGKSEGCGMNVLCVEGRKEACNVRSGGGEQWRLGIFMFPWHMMPSTFTAGGIANAGLSDKVHSSIASIGPNQHTRADVVPEC